MRRLLIALFVLAVGLGGTPTEVAAEKGRAACEGYCATVAVGCYVLVGWAIGREKCDAMYQGCVDGCVAALVEE
jgi:hypothetical protein